MNILGTLTDILYPRRCPVCDAIIPVKEEKICPACRNKLIVIREPICKKCGKILENEEEEYCSDCRKRNLYYNEGRAVFLYDDNMRRSIYQFKYNNKREYAGFYANEILKVLAKDIKRWRGEALIPIPIHKKKRKARGFNQAEVLAGELAGDLQISVRNDIIIREKNTSAQKLLTLQERQNNLKNAFKIVNNDVKLNSIILIDDIYTTGCTINEAAKLLKKTGISNIYFICIAIGRGN